MSGFEVRPLAVELFLSTAHTRVPFRFGSATVTRAPILTARVSVEAAGGTHAGHAADLLVPRWFRKDIERSADGDARALVDSTLGAAELLLADAGSTTVHEHWRRSWDGRVETLPFDAPERLERGFGVALLERALIDAACRAHGVSFFAALRTGGLGGPPELAAQLRAEPLARLSLRHTIGLLDELTGDERGVAAHARDGLPSTLADEIRERGLAHFKVKLRGDVELDRARLLAVWRVIEGMCESVPRVSLDGNEQFSSLGEVARLLEGLACLPEGARLLQRVTHIEQPVPRAATFVRDTAVERVRVHAPLAIDEADVGLEAFERAFELGYRGVSVKNCKGVLRSLIARTTCARLGDGAFQTGEDLTNLPLFALQQDLATMAALGLDSIERNGHHYFAGLAHLPSSEVQAALRAHPDLYEPWRDHARLRIRGGALDIGSLDCIGFACAVPFDAKARTRLAEWRWEGRA